MKIGVVGPGAMGLLFAGLLSRAEHDVCVLDYKRDRAERLNQTGVEVSGLEEFCAKPRFSADPKSLADCELVIVFVKAYSTRRVAETLGDVGGSNHVLTLQNGLGNAEMLADALGEARVFAGTTSFGATKLSDSEVRFAGRGDIHLGALASENFGRAGEYAQMFTECDLPAKATSDPFGAIWSKAIINVGINALTAIAGVQNGKVAEYPELWELSVAAVQEADAVARAEGVELLFDDSVEATKNVCTATAQNRSSMLQDIEAKRRTEIDFINGAVARLADEHDIQAPVNHTLWKMVSALERANGESG